MMHEPLVLDAFDRRLKHDAATATFDVGLNGLPHHARAERGYSNSSISVLICAAPGLRTC